MAQELPLAERLTRRFPNLADALSGFDARTALILLLSAVMLLVFKKFGGSAFFDASLASAVLKQHPHFSVFSDAYWFLSCFVMLGVIPFLTLSVATRRMDPGPPDLGLGTGLGDWRFGLRSVLILYLVMLPFVLAASRTEIFYGYYPLNSDIRSGAVTFLRGDGPADFLAWFVLYEALYAVYFVGWEYFFRGFMTFGLHQKLGFNGILVANVPFALLHAGKPIAEALGSVIAGVVLGVFALRARSFWYCWLLHALIACTMDVAAIERRLELELLP